MLNAFTEFGVPESSSPKVEEGNFLKPKKNLYSYHKIHSVVQLNLPFATFLDQLYTERFHPFLITTTMTRLLTPTFEVGTDNQFQPAFDQQSHYASSNCDTDEEDILSSESS
jgi:hypothetical protein